MGAVDVTLRAFTAGDGSSSRSRHVFLYKLMSVVRKPAVP